ncbi:hypothetical protein JD974_17050 [Chromobacterium haemolyticum]|uniref:Transcriptional regulator n=1 Tax=Chromobacterium haemolyticum TaxID=394935 RepID=A0ABS3GQI6_9NEIS|nr:hypothetical protein [Chromobacterium haemolyticum]MBK0416119.1 hypothetical protein [Chromobacterium haemolyticum]MBO0417315.1 hypothetical protein [Chromobacterium haemolyticum]MBO0500550.1 hypothetical protein [Chromobacterium haemolyticum]
MPRIECDKPLQARLEQVVRDTGNPTVAAKLLCLERTMVWRFFRTGCAIPKNREALVAALDTYEAGQQKNATNATRKATTEPLGQLANLSTEDIRRMRMFFQSMIAVLDCYEKSGLLVMSNGEVSTSVGVEK